MTALNKTPPTKLLLFDIDGTLLNSGGAGEKALRLALRDRFGRDDDLEKVEIAGRTDSAIARQIFAQHGIDANGENLRDFLDGYLQHLEELLPKTKGTLLPGVMDLLKILRGRSDVALGLLTGNLARGAELKLRYYGIWDFFKFGAFADDAHDRSELGAFACRRGEEAHDCRFSPGNIFVIGDTPHDIACGRACPAKTVAVATGNFSRQQLAAHSPDYLFDHLADVDRTLAVLGL